jgi:hypothetical protein
MLTSYRTYILHGLGLIVSVADYIAGLGVIDDPVARAILAVVNVLGIILRKDTTGPAGPVLPAALRINPAILLVLGIAASGCAGMQGATMSCDELRRAQFGLVAMEGELAYRRGQIEAAIESRCAVPVPEADGDVD